MYKIFYSLSTVPTNDNDYLDINFTLQFNEKDLNPISNLLSMNIITNYLWKLFAKISDDYLFINQKSKYIDTYLTFGMRNILYKTDYESLYLFNSVYISKKSFIKKSVLFCDFL